MKLTLESTPQIILYDGIPTRVWVGTTESGCRVTAFVTSVAVDSGQDASEFERELSEHVAPTFDWPRALAREAVPHDFFFEDPEDD
jgi:hypothetical protein